MKIALKKAFGIELSAKEKVMEMARDLLINDPGSWCFNKLDDDYYTRILTHEHTCITIEQRSFMVYTYHSIEMPDGVSIDISKNGRILKPYYAIRKRIRNDELVRSMREAEPK